CLDLPPEIVQHVPVFLGRKASTVYREIEDAAIARLSSDATVSAANVLTELLRLQQAAGGWVTTDDGRTVQVGTEKLDALMDLLVGLHWNARRKRVVFCRGGPVIRASLAACEMAGIAAAGLYGETKERGELARRFQEEADPPVMVIHS